MRNLLHDKEQLNEFREKLDAFLSENGNFLTGTDENGKEGPMYLLCFVTTAPSLGAISRGVNMAELLAIAKTIDPDAYDKHMAIHAVDLIRANNMPGFADQIERQIWQKQTLSTMFSGTDNAIS